MGAWRRIVPKRESQQLFDLLLNRPAGFVRKMIPLVAKATLLPWPPQDAHGKPSLYLGHGGLERKGFDHWLAATRQRPVYFVHDLIPITHAEYCRDGEQAAHVLRMTTMLRTGAAIVSNSQCTLDTLAEFAGARGLPMPRCTVAALAPTPWPPKGATKAPLNSAYFVVLGTIEPRKNHLLLLNVWRELVLRLGQQAPHLVVIGQRGWECENVVDMLERCDALKPFVHELVSCTDDTLGAYLTHARALLFPSFAEGYGLPLVEALSLGTPVVANDLRAFREIAGDVPDYLSPIDGLGWLQAVIDYDPTPSARRESQLLRMKGFQAPTWESHFATVDRLLGQLA